MNFRHLRWLFILPITLFVGFYEWVRHYPLHEFIEELLPGWQENFFSVLIMMGIVAVFSHQLFVYIKHLNRELVIEREKLRLAFEHSADAIVVIGHDKIIKKLNLAASRLLGRPQAEFGSLRCYEVLKCNDIYQNPICGSACIADPSLLTKKSSYNVEVSLHCREGQYIPVSISCSAIGQEEAAVLIIRDMREKKRLEEEVEALAKIERGNPGCNSMPELIYILVNKILEVALVDFVIYCVVGEGKPGQEIFAGVTDELEIPVRQKVQQVVQAVLKTGKMETHSGEGVTEPTEAGPAENGLALIAYPVFCCNDNLIGVITCGRLRNLFSVPEMNTITQMVQQVTLVVENHLLYQQVKDGAIIEERYRLAREIHDGLAQGLSYLNLRCKVVADYVRAGRIEKVSQEIEELRQVVKQLYQEARNSILDLKIISAIGQDFADYLANYLIQFEEKASVKTTLVLPGDPVRIARKAEQHVIRIIQEALVNIRKHANASEAEVVISKKPKGLQVRISDNGISFSHSGDDREHFGLIVMQERAALIGATVSVAPGKYGGTVVTVDLPADNGGEDFAAD